MTVKPQDVIDQALDLVEMENSTGTSGFAVTSRLQDLFNKGLSKLHYTLADADNDWFSKETDVSVVADTKRYVLPNDFYKLKNVFLKYNDRLYPLEKFQSHEIGGWRATGPNRSETVRIQYVPAYEPLARADSWSGKTMSYAYPPGWDDYVANFIAVRPAIRDEQYERAQFLSGERDQALMHVMQHVSPRDLGTPDRVVDTTERWNAYLTSRYHYYYRRFRYRLWDNYLEIGQPSSVV